MLRPLLLTAISIILGGCAAAPVAAPPQLAQLDAPTLPGKPDEKDEVRSPLAGAPAEIIAPTRPLNPNERAAAQIHIMAGEMAAGRNQPAEAAAQFLAALELADEPELAQRATALALSANERGLSLRAARKWLELQPNEMDPREVIARLSIENGDTAEALAQCVAMVSGHAGGVDEGLNHVARLLAQASSKSADSALEVMRKLAAQHPQASAAQQGLAIVALRHGRLDEAEAAARKAKALAPKTREPSVLLAGVLVRQKKLDEADQLFESVIAQEQEPAELRLGYARVLLDAGERDRARTQTRKALAAKPGYADALIALGVMAFNDKNYDEAEVHFKLALNGERAMDAAFQLGLVAEERHDYVQALGYYERVRSGNQAVDALIRRSQVLAKLKKLPEARALLTSLRRQLPQLARRLYIAEATLLSEAKADGEALKLYEAALGEYPGDADLLYSRSLLHERLQRIDLAEADLRAMLKNDAKDSRAMNALGYMLTVHTKRFQEARQLIAGALALEPEDAAILDSMGWVHFKLGKSGEARDYLQKAFDKAPDPEIAAHLGEVLWSLGEQDKARAVWEQALKDDPEHEVLNSTVQRFKR